MVEAESVYGKGFYDFEKHLKFFTMQGKQGYEACFMALELSELMVVDPQWARAMNMRLKDCVDVLYKTIEPRGRKPHNSLNSYMLMKTPIPGEIDLSQLDGTRMTEELLIKLESLSHTEEMRKNQGSEVYLVYDRLKEEFMLKYRELQAEGKVSDQAYLIGQVVGLWACTKTKSRAEFIKNHQQAFISKHSAK